MTLYECLGQGTSGGALALTLCDALRALLNFLATRRYGDPRTLPDYCSKALWGQVLELRGIVELLKLSLPGALTVWSEWWAWECCVPAPNNDFIYGRFVCKLYVRIT